jgi:hypothetical protein
MFLLNKIKTIWLGCSLKEAQDNSKILLRRKRKRRRRVAKTRERRSQ